MKQLEKIFWGFLIIAVLAICYIKTSKTSENKDAESVVGAAAKIKSIVNKAAESVVGADGKTYESYQSACNAGDFDAAREILAKMKKEYEDFKKNNKMFKSNFITGYRDYSNENKYNAMVQSYMEAENYVFNAEILYLISQNSEEATNRLFFLLSEYQLSGLPPSPSGEYKGNDYDKVKEYIASVARYNGHCNNALDLAISQGYQSLAKRIIHLFKQNVDVEYEGIGREMRVSPKGVNNTDKEAAQKKYDEAVKAGAFNLE